MRSSRVEWRPFGGGAGGANDISSLLFFWVQVPQQFDDRLSSRVRSVPFQLNFRRASPPTSEFRGQKTFLCDKFHFRHFWQRVNTFEC